MRMARPRRISSGVLPGPARADGGGAWGRWRWRRTGGRRSWGGPWRSSGRRCRGRPRRSSTRRCPASSTRCTRARTHTHRHTACAVHPPLALPSLGPSLALSRVCVCRLRPLPASMAWLTLSRESASRPLGLCVLDRPQFAFKPPPFALVETPPPPPPLSSAHAPRVLWRLTHPARCQAYAKAKNLLLDNRPALDALAKLLIEKETVTADEFQQILNDTGVKIGSYGIYA